MRRQTRPAKIVPLLVISLAFLLGILAINIDGGRLMEERRRYEGAASFAAQAAAAELYADYWTYQGVDPTGRARAAAERLAEANGVPTNQLTVNIPPQSGIYTGKAGYVEVIIKGALPATFGRVITRSDPVIHARCVARGMPMRLGVILLRRNGTGLRNDALAFTILNAPLIVNSSDRAAIRHETLGVFLASRADVVGGVENLTRLLLSTPVRTGRRPVPDPLAYLPIPDSSALSTRAASPTTINSLLPTVLRPGVYQGGLRIQGASIVVMQPGVYVMEGGGFQVSDLATVTGLGVMIYNTSSSAFAPGPIAVTGLGKVVLTAPTSGTYQGLNFFQNRSQTTPIDIRGAGLATITGTVYAASAPAHLNGLVSAGVNVLGGAYVVDTMTVTGVGAVNIDLRLNPPRIPDIRVVE